MLRRGGEAGAAARAGLIGALLAATSPLLVWHAQDARAYALTILLCAVAFLAFLHLLDGERRPWLAVWAVASVLALTAHYDAVFPFAVQAAWLLRFGPARIRRGVLTASAAVVASAASPLLPLAYAQLEGDVRDRRRDRRSRGHRSTSPAATARRARAPRRATSPPSSSSATSLRRS